MTTKYKLHQFATKRFYQKLDLLVEKKVFENKRIVIFGTSKIASMMITYLAHKNVKIDYIIDNNCNAARAEIDGIEIYSPSDLLQVYQEDVIILIASSYQKEMIAQLSEMGYELDKQIVKVVDLPELMNDYSYVDRDEFNERNQEQSVKTARLFYKCL